MPRARIKLTSTNPKELDYVCGSIKDIADKVGVSMKGPVPLPTKRLKIPVRKSPVGSGRESYETWEMRIHKRMIDMGVDDRGLRQIMRIPIPKSVNIEMEIVE